MKTLLSILLVTLFSHLAIAQTTAIPDTNFEQALIDLGLDSSPIDGQVPTSNISTITYLFVNNKNISDLTGIEDFTALTELHCAQNQMTVLDVSQNTSLIKLVCSVNQLTTLDVSQTLQNLACSVNQLTTLDLSQNTSLIGLVCEFNPLTCLNVKNGNNANLGWIYANDLPNLICIEVDDVAFSTTNWTVIDPQTSFSTDCGNSCSSIWTDIEETNLTNFSLYPNPTTGNFTIDLGETFTDVKTTLTNSLGQVILTENYTLTNFINLDINTPKGIYFLQIVSNGESKTIRIIKT